YPNEYEGDTVKVYGWRTKTDLFSICSDTIAMFPKIYIDNISLSNEIDIKKRIYVNGIVHNVCANGTPACFLHIIAIDYYIE
ncbi:MAG: hypothetical protein LBC68_14845, partial [Prevotellaceae bacterium]|nr:hypothetical protein [Prevotellaceae bacterium]